jgi:hypothetical protein
MCALRRIFFFPLFFCEMGMGMGFIDVAWGIILHHIERDGRERERERDGRIR